MVALLLYVFYYINLTPELPAQAPLKAKAESVDENDEDDDILELGARDDLVYVTSKEFFHDHKHAVELALRVANYAADLQHGAYSGCKFFELFEQEETNLVELAARVHRATCGKTRVSRKVIHGRWATRIRDAYVVKGQKPLIKRKRSPSAPIKPPVRKRSRS